MEYTEMKDRIAHIIRAKNMTAAEFAIRLGIQPSNVSHLLAGRNNPSLEFVKKLKETFPEYNLDWIVLGKGPITVSEPFVEMKATGNTSESLGNGIVSELDTTEGTLFAPEVAPEAVVEHIVNEPAVSQAPTQDLKQMILVYSDHTFEVLSPR